MREECGESWTQSYEIVFEVSENECSDLTVIKERTIRSL
jgi:hypothetical protein